MAFCLFAVLAALGAQQGYCALVINEFMADNDATVTDPEGKYEDWIEIYNTGDFSISLEGYYLSDDLENPAQWTFPAATIPAGGYLCIWADDDEGDEGIHTNFKLSKSGEAIILSAPDESILDQVIFGAQETDVSTGRYPNGTGEFVKLVPSFGAENSELAASIGDIDGNGSVEMEDAILALQIMAGMDTGSVIYSGSGVDGDGGIGLQEALFILSSILGFDGVTYITLNNTSVAVDGEGATVDGAIVTISAGGTYSITGTLNDGRIIVDSNDSVAVNIVLNGVSVTCSTTAPFFVSNAEKTIIELAENTENYFVDTNNYVFEEGEDEPDAPVFSKDDLTIRGSGLLNVDANYNDAIKSKDGLVIENGVFVVNSLDDGIQGKDYLNIQGGVFTVNADGDGLKSTEDEDPDLGYITISGGNFTIVSGNDCIQAETDVNITGGAFNLTAGGGSNATIGDDDSAKGIKAVVEINIDAGNFIINTADDAVHSDQDIAITGGDFSIATGDDGVHSDSKITIDGGAFAITKCYEGMESTVITINDGNFHITASDDGLNVAGGADSSGGGMWPDTSNNFLHINGGYIVVDADGDGIDVNGSFYMSGGTVLVNGPEENGNGALDYDTKFVLTGGYLIAAGSAGMAQAPTYQDTTQYSVLYRNRNINRSAGTLIHVQDTSGNAIFTFAPSKNYQSVCFSMPALSHGASYDLYFEGSSTGATTDGLYEGGTYTPGTKYQTFTISNIVTNIN
ncbi:protein of unknown function [Desulfatibacillum alkenivorans DSM 16219]|jgi:hypothetical protein|uniref:LTD domain-containing protein n=1 Tax=Desulfatibacillum alkenivorans DSM 16219 TaxID=1121393 RepID=A0A1M6SF28_9BACT|nr:carbohydrate-binding domain-containing protein [Desulfatibacillum alkenivorans]SHK43343.1 protein of unknown function [Desulfatibacillum alkenivorans DSM 16219]